MAQFYVFFAFAFVVLRIVYKTISIQLRKRFLAAFTAVDDIPLLGNFRKPEHRISGTAVICGGRYVASACLQPFISIRPKSIVRIAVSQVYSPPECALTISTMLS